MAEFEPTTAAEPGASGGVVLARALRAQGVDTVFGLPGGHVLGFFDACLDEGIRVIDVRHEGAASLAAEGWALAAGRPGVAVVTAGPGFGNAMTGLMDAGLGGVPMVLVAGRTGIDRQGRGAVMDLDQRAIATPATKWAASCHETARIGEYAARALREAASGRPGSVYLEIPQDVFMASTPAAAPHEAAPAARSRPDAESVGRAAGALARAERPITIAGSGAFFSGAGGALASFARAARVPVTTTSAARGLLPDADDWCLGSMVHAGIAVARADVVLVVGSAFNANLLYGRPPLFGENQTLIQVDVDEGRIDPRSIALAGDAAAALEALAASAREPAAGREAWREEARALVRFARAAWDHQVDSHAGARIHAGAAARELAAFARETGPHTIVADGGDCLSWMLAYADAEGPGRLLTTTTALGTLGVGMPFANAAAAARPGEPVYVFIGDGTFGLCAMEVDTAVRHGLPVIVVVSNNAAWADVTHEQDAWFGPGRHIASELGDSRYELIADAFGAHGEVVEDLDELRPALKRSLDAGAAVINLRTDPGVLSDLLRNMGSLRLM
ncbi:MAG TPA: thiamine pyrophosphate-binding protein [Actinomycetota bacterium]